MRGRATRTTDPLGGPVDFERFGPVRRNAFAGAGEPGGPSLLALWEMPQLATVVLRELRDAPSSLVWHGSPSAGTGRCVATYASAEGGSR